MRKNKSEILVLYRRFRSSTGKYGQKKPVFLPILHNAS